MSEYVTNESWVRVLARADAIDEIADQFERREQHLEPTDERATPV